MTRRMVPGMSKKYKIFSFSTVISFAMSAGNDKQNDPRRKSWSSGADANTLNPFQGPIDQSGPFGNVVYDLGQVFIQIRKC